MELLQRHLPRVYEALQSALNYLGTVTAQIFGAPPPNHQHERNTHMALDPAPSQPAHPSEIPAPSNVDRGDTKGTEVNEHLTPHEDDTVLDPTSGPEKGNCSPASYSGQTVVVHAVVTEDLNVETELRKRAKRDLVYEAHDERTIRDLPSEEFSFYREPKGIKYDHLQAEKMSTSITFSKHQQHEEKNVAFLSNDPTPPPKMSNKSELNSEDQKILDFEINKLEIMSLNAYGGSLVDCDCAVTAQREEVHLDYKQDAELAEVDVLPAVEPKDDLSLLVIHAITDSSDTQMKNQDLSHNYIKKETNFTKVTFQNDPEGDIKEELITSVTSQKNPESQLAKKEKIEVRNYSHVENTSLFTLGDLGTAEESHEEIRKSRIDVNDHHDNECQEVNVGAFQMHAGHPIICGKIKLESNDGIIEQNLDDIPESSRDDHSVKKEDNTLLESESTIWYDEYEAETEKEVGYDNKLHFPEYSLQLTTESMQDKENTEMLQERNEQLQDEELITFSANLIKDVLRGVCLAGQHQISLQAAESSVGENDFITHVIYKEKRDPSLEEANESPVDREDISAVGSLQRMELTKAEIFVREAERSLIQDKTTILQEVECLNLSATKHAQTNEDSEEESINFLQQESSLDQPRHLEQFVKTNSSLTDICVKEQSLPQLEDEVLQTYPSNETIFTAKEDLTSGKGENDQILHKITRQTSKIYESGLKEIKGVSQNESKAHLESGVHDCNLIESFQLQIFEEGLNLQTPVDLYRDRTKEESCDQTDRINEKFEQDQATYVNTTQDKLIGQIPSTFSGENEEYTEETFTTKLSKTTEYSESHREIGLIAEPQLLNTCIDLDFTNSGSELVFFEEGQSNTTSHQLQVEHIKEETVKSLAGEPSKETEILPQSVDPTQDEETGKTTADFGVLSNVLHLNSARSQFSDEETEKDNDPAGIMHPSHQEINIIKAADDLSESRKDMGVVSHMQPEVTQTHLVDDAKELANLKGSQLFTMTSQSQCVWKEEEIAIEDAEQAALFSTEHQTEIRRIDILSKLMKEAEDNKNLYTTDQLEEMKSIVISDESVMDPSDELNLSPVRFLIEDKTGGNIKDMTEPQKEVDMLLDIQPEVSADHSGDFKTTIREGAQYFTITGHHMEASELLFSSRSLVEAETKCASDCLGSVEGVIETEDNLKDISESENKLDMLSKTINEKQVILEESFNTSEQSQLVEGENILEEKNLPTYQPEEVRNVIESDDHQSEKELNVVSDVHSDFTQSYIMEDVKGIAGKFAVGQSHELREHIMETSTKEQTHSITGCIEDQEVQQEEVNVSDLLPKTGFIQDLKPIEPTSHLTEVRITEDSDILGNIGASPEVNIVITTDHGSSEDKNSLEIKSSVEKNAIVGKVDVHTATDQKGEHLETSTEKPHVAKSDLLSEAEVSGKLKTKETFRDQDDGTLLPHSTLDLSAQKSRVILRRKTSIRKRPKLTLPDPETVEQPPPIARPIFPVKLPSIAPLHPKPAPPSAEVHEEEKTHTEGLAMKPKKGLPRLAGFGVPHPQMMQELQNRLQKKKPNN